MPLFYKFMDSGFQRSSKGLLGVIPLVEGAAGGLHGSQLLRGGDGLFQSFGQLYRVVVVVYEAVYPLGHEAGSAGMLRHDGRLAEDQPSVTKVGIGSSREAQTKHWHWDISDLISSRVSRLQ